MKAFDPLPENSQKLKGIQSLLETELGRNVSGKEVLKDKVDSYNLAVILSQCLQTVVQEEQQISGETKNLLLKLVDDFKGELEMLRKEPDLIKLQLQAVQAQLKPKTEPVIRNAKSKPAIRAHKMEVMGDQDSSRKGEVRTFLDLAYEGVEQLQGYFSVGVKGQTQARNPEADLEVREALVKYQGAGWSDEISVGKKQKRLGQGLVQDGVHTSVEVSKKYQEYDFRFGLDDGIFAQVSGDFLLNIPVTFYGMDHSDGAHSGLFMSKKFNKLTLSSEIAEYHPDRPQANNNRVARDRSAFSLGLEVEALPNIKLGSNLTHTGGDFEGRNNVNSYFEPLSLSMRNEILRSLSNYFGEDYNALSGYSDLNFNFSLANRRGAQLQLHYNMIYDHTLDNSQSFSEFNVASLYLSKDFSSGSKLSLSFQNLDFEKSAFAQGMLVNKNLKDVQVVRSSYQVRF